MAKWTAEKRRQYKQSHPENWGDKEHWLFPIEDQEDIDSAGHLIGKAKNPDAVKRQLLAICKRLKLTPPKAWQSEMSRTADFAVASADGDMVLRTGKLWEAGDYPDKDFEMTPEENWAAVEAFGEALDVDLEHVPTILNGHLGKLQEVRLSDDGTEIEGTLAIPKWLNDVVGEEPLKVSCTWNREQKTLDGLALVMKPRVSDAAVMSAFAAFTETQFAGKRHDTPSGQSLLQMMHDDAARAGAKCSRSNTADMARCSERNTVDMHSGHELEGIQAIHDVTVKHGAMCRSLSMAGPNQTTGYYPGFSQGSAGDRSPTSAGPGGVKMTLLDRVKQALGSAASTEVTDEPAGGAAGAGAGAGAAAATETKPADMSAGQPANQPDPRVQALEEQVARMQRESIEKDAVAFATGLVRDGKATPAEAAKIAANFTQAAVDDAAHATKVTFGEGQQGTRLDAFKAMMDARPANKLQADTLRSGDVLFNQQHTPGLNPGADAAATQDKLKAEAEAYAKSVNRSAGKGA